MLFSVAAAALLLSDYENRFLFPKFWKRGRRINVLFLGTWWNLAVHGSSYFDTNFYRIKKDHISLQYMLEKEDSGKLPRFKNGSRALGIDLTEN